MSLKILAFPEFTVSLVILGFLMWLFCRVSFFFWGGGLFVWDFSVASGWLFLDSLIFHSIVQQLSPHLCH